MSSLKVVQLLPELNTGGVERGATDLSTELVKRGHSSYLISNGGIFEEEVTRNGGVHIKIPIHKKSIQHYFLPISYLQYINKLIPILFMSDLDFLH